MVHPLAVRAPEPASPHYDAIIIGSGMSGLAAAVILAKEGKRVLVLEQHYRPGGFLHRFYRKGGIEFDVGFHYLGAIERGQVLGAYFDYLGIRERVPLIALDPDGYDEVRVPGFEFVIPAGEQRYRERLLARFPNEHAAIDSYFRDCRKVVEGLAFYQLRVEQDIGHADRWMSNALGSYLDSLGVSPDLRAVLAAQNPLYGVEPKRAPVGLHAVVTDSFLQNPYAVRGGGATLARLMVERITELGGEVKLRRRVSEILVDDDRQVQGVRTDRGETFFAPLAVSCAHPKTTVRLLPDGVLRPGFRRRILGMEDGPATISVFITTKADLSRYGRRNYYVYEELDFDRIYANSDRRHEFAFVTVPTAREGLGKNGLHQVIGIGFLDWSRVAKWAESRTKHRPADYEEFKNRQTDDLLRLVCEVVPELRGNIESVEAATPLTNRDYAVTENGAAYGIHHCVEQAGRYGLRPRTRVGGLYLAGQSVLMPGVCGVTISAFHTCSIILGSEYLMRKVHAAAF
jgi:all-trans-retinol 13,14-reductase